MRNVWKGMVLGALAGAGVGLAVDALEGLGREGRAIGRQGVSGARDLAAQGQHAVADADLPGLAREVVAHGRDVVADADASSKVKDTTARVREAAAEVADRSVDAVQGRVADAKERLDR